MAAVSRTTALTPGDGDVRSQLERVAASDAFDTSQRARDFLRFVVEETLARRADAISQHAIAHRVFGRGEEFDPTTDPIVRMQAGRVRRSLEHYYLTAGKNDPIRISLPKGTYVPTFHTRVPAPATSPPTDIPTTADTWPTLLVSPLRNLTGHADVDFIAQGLASDLAAELNRYTAISVFLSRHPAAEPTGAERPQFELTGTVARRDDEFRITFHLVETRSGRQTWAHAYHCPSGPDRGVDLDRVVQTTAATVAEEHGVLASHFRGDTSQRPVTGSSAYEAILRYHHFELTHEPQAFLDAFAALRRAVQANPDCAPCWSYLARLGATHWSLGIPGEIIPFQESLAAARRGAELAPTDLRCRVVLAYLCLLGDEIDEARAEADAALQLSHMSIYWLDAVGYLLTLAGDWERGPQLIRNAVQVNPFPRRACYCALWLDALRRGDADEAIADARKSWPEAYFWTPLMQAVALVGADRPDEAHTHIRRLLRIQPDFTRRAHWFITRYVKSHDLVVQIEDALTAAGLPRDQPHGTPTSRDTD